MGAAYVAIGDHDLTIVEIVHLPIRFAPLVRDPHPCPSPKGEGTVWASEDSSKTA